MAHLKILREGSINKPSLCFHFSFWYFQYCIKSHILAVHYEILYQGGSDEDDTDEDDDEADDNAGTRLELTVACSTGKSTEWFIPYGLKW